MCSCLAPHANDIVATHRANDVDRVAAMLLQWAEGGAGRVGSIEVVAVRSLLKVAAPAVLGHMGGRGSRFTGAVQTQRPPTAGTNI